MKAFFYNRFKTLEEKFEADGYEIVQSHKGEWSRDEVEGFAYDLEAKLKESGTKKSIVKRIFSLIIEALQNIRLHGERDVDNLQHSFYFIAKNDIHFVIVTANLLKDERVELVKGRIDKINELDKPALKAFYMETLTDGKRSDKGGAGLGFITVAMKAKNKLNYYFYEIDNGLSMFEMDCIISLKKEE